MWRSRLCKDLGKAIQAIDSTVRELNKEGKNGNGLIADFYGGTEVNLVTGLEFYSKFGSLESLLNLELKHEMVTAIRVKVFPGVLPGRSIMEIAEKR